MASIIIFFHFIFLFELEVNCKTKDDNNSNKVLHKSQLSKGGLTGTIVDSRIIFKKALECNATSLILTHNHPSGKLLASEADKEVTRKLKLAGQQMDILVLDHVIVTETGFYSFNDEGIF